MTISTQIARAQYAGNGVTTSFTIPFEFLTGAGVSVIYTAPAGTDVTWIQGTNYTLTGGGAQQPATGSIVATVAPPLGSRVTILRNEALTQTADYIPDDPFPATAHEKALDRLSMQIQMLKERLDRSVTFNESSTVSGIKIADPVANKLIGWNDDATALVNKDIVATPGYVAGAIGLQILLSDVPATVRDLLDTPVYVVDRTVLKAIDTTKDNVAVLMEAGREGVFVWKAGNYATQVTADTAEGIYIKATAVLASAGAWVRAYSGNARAAWFGTNQAAIVAGQAVVDDLDVDTAFNFTSTVTLPRGKRLWFRDGGLFNIATAVTVTIRGQVFAGLWRGVVVAGPNKIFNCTGTGKVLGLGDAWPEMWGALGDDATDDWAAMQACHDCLEASAGSDFQGMATMRLRGGGNYTISQTLTLRPTNTFNFAFEGAGGVLGCRIKARTTFTGSLIILVDGSSNANFMIANYSLRNFSVGVQAGSTATHGIGFNGNATAAVNLIGLQQNLVENVSVNGLAFGFQVNRARLIKFDRCSTWAETLAGSIGVNIICTGTTAFTGDIDFYDCQFAHPVTTGRGVRIASDVSGNQIKGVRFHGCTWYRGGDDYCIIAAQNGGICGDIWFNPGCQFDGFGQTQLHLYVDGAGSSLDNIHVRGCYFRGVNATFNAIRLENTNTGTPKMKNIFINNNWFANINNTAILSTGVSSSVSIRGNQFLEISNTTGKVIVLGSCSRVSVNDNILDRDGAAVVAYLVEFAAGCNYYTAVNNIAGGMVSTGVVLDTAAGANKTITPNL